MVNTNSPRGGPNAINVQPKNSITVIFVVFYTPVIQKTNFILFFIFLVLHREQCICDNFLMCQMQGSSLLR